MIMRFICHNFGSANLSLLPVANPVSWLSKMTLPYSI